VPRSGKNDVSFDSYNIPVDVRMPPSSAVETTGLVRINGKIPSGYVKKTKENGPFKDDCPIADSDLPICSVYFVNKCSIFDLTPQAPKTRDIHVGG